MMNYTKVYFNCTQFKHLLYRSYLSPPGPSQSLLIVNAASPLKAEPTTSLRAPIGMQTNNIHNGQ